MDESARELEELMSRLLDDDLDGGGQIRLAQLLRDPRARAIYRGFCSLHADLSVRFREQGDEIVAPAGSAVHTRPSPDPGEPPTSASREEQHPAGSFGIAALAVAAFIVAPAVLVALVGAFGGDYGLAVSGWAESVRERTLTTAVVLTAGLVVAWAWARGYHWVKIPDLYAVSGVAALVVAVVVCRGAAAIHAEREQIRIEELIQSHKWISYDSALYSPADLEGVIGKPAQEPTAEQIRRELTLLREGGFDGLFIHEARKGQLPVARLAREIGFSGIVQCIRVASPQDLGDARTQQQIANAIAVGRDVDLICLGELNAREVIFEALKKDLARIRWETKKPVTVSFISRDDLGTEGRLRAVEDFTVRSLARPWKGDRADPAEAAAAVKRALLEFKSGAPDRPAFLTTVLYPSGGGEGFSEENQYRFFAEVLECQKEADRGINLVVFNSFDRPWAARLAEARPKARNRWEGHTGLFGTEERKDGDVVYTAKKALQLFAPRQ